MKIFDCFMFYDEEMLLDIRLNILDKYVDQFIIVESDYTHSGKKRDFLFDIRKFKKFEHKINYLALKGSPKDIEEERRYLIFLNPGLKDLSNNDMEILAKNSIIREKIKIKGYLEDFALSKKEADDLVMSARNKVYKD